MLAVWGSKDPYFLPAGAEAFKKDLPDAKVKFYNTGHFALETHVNEMGAYILNFLATNGKFEAVKKTFNDEKAIICFLKYLSQDKLLLVINSIIKH